MGNPRGVSFQQQGVNQKWNGGSMVTGIVSLTEKKNDSLHEGQIVYDHRSYSAEAGDEVIQRK